MNYEEACRMARHLANLHREPYVVSLRRSFFRSQWCAEPRWLYLSVQHRRRQPTHVAAEVSLQQTEGEHS
jgi:hypothetical protein